MDYGKYKYEQNRRARKAKKKQHQTQLKEIKMRPKIDDHDYGFKMDHARDFLTARDKVKFTIMFRGREMAHQEIGHQLIQKAISELSDIASVEANPKSEGRTLTAVLMPKPLKTGGKESAPGTPPATEKTASSAPAKTATNAAAKSAPSPSGVRMEAGSKE